jgi:hypothetical protein
MNIDGLYPNVQISYGFYNPLPKANDTSWPTDTGDRRMHYDISQLNWRADQPLVNLTRYYSTSLHRHEVSTGWVDSTAFSPEPAATQPGSPLYRCTSSGILFISNRSDCEGYVKDGTNYLLGFAHARL